MLDILLALVAGWFLLAAALVIGAARLSATWSRHEAGEAEPESRPAGLGALQSAASRQRQ